MGINGCHDGPVYYRVANVIHAGRSASPGHQEVDGVVKDADDYAYETTGSLDLGCGEGMLDLRFDANVPLSAKAPTKVDIEFPKKFRVTSASGWGWSGTPAETHVSVLLPADTGTTHDSKRTEGRFTVSLGVAGSTVRGEHVIPAELHGL
ncbi:hypothetical protein [Streptomyces sp. KL116D]|uniref:hypothetical protein n=1 Tax=Streptomyces sp. KL116D TaxID=3045152 RepID=UPI003556ED1B